MLPAREQTNMAQQGKDGMISIGGRWWRFPGAWLDTDSWEMEWRDDKLHLHENTGNVIEGAEVTEAETEQVFREVQLADVLELAIAKLRSGEGWDEGTTGDVLFEILHIFPEHAKRALGLALLSGKF